VLLNGYFAIDEYLHPIIQDLNSYMYLCSGLTGVGVLFMGSVEYFARRFINTAYLQSDGKRLRLTFHSAYTFNKRETTIKISDLQYGDEISEDNIKVNIPGRGKVYFSLHRNELLKEELANQLFSKIVHGY
jgi:hypothetical protein